MKYEDLTRMYWDLHKVQTCINDIIFDDVHDIVNLNERLNWCIETINEELRNIEIYTSQCD